jgi:hypothetical protein
VISPLRETFAKGPLAFDGNVTPIATRRQPGAEASRGCEGADLIARETLAGIGYAFAALAGAIALLVIARLFAPRRPPTAAPVAADP